MENIGTIKFTPAPKGFRVEFEMPIQIRNDGQMLHIKVPLLGNLETVAKNESDIDRALVELSDCFIKAADQFGKGVYQELISLGWSGTRNSVRFKLNARDRRPRFNTMIQSGIQTTKKKFSVPG